MTNKAERPGAGAGRLEGGPVNCSSKTDMQVSRRSTGTSTRERVKGSWAAPWPVTSGVSNEDSELQAAIVDLDMKKGEVKRYLLING